jgi:hypothetical protein
MRETLLDLRDFLHHQMMRARQEPAEYLLKPGIKAVVVIGLLTGAAHWAQERYAPRKAQKQLSHARSVKAPVMTGSVKR